MAKFGSAAITWTDTSAGTERILLLDAPLRNLRPGYGRTAYTAESLDKTSIYSITVGSGAHELVGTVKYEDDPQGLVDMVQAGATNTSLNYYPNLTDPDTVFAVKLLSPRDVGSLTIDLDSQRATFGEMQVEVRFRKTDQSAFTPLYGATNVLWSFVAGRSVTTTEFSRAGTGYYASKGYGTLTNAASGAARLTWTDVNADAAREMPGLLLEPARTNLVTQSANLSAWTAVGTPVLTSGQGDPLGTTTAYLLNDNNAGSASYVNLTPTYTGNASKALSLWMKQGTTPNANGNTILLRDNTAVANRLVATTIWTNGVPSVTATTGTFVAKEQWRDGWWRVKFRTTAVTAANTHEIRLYGTTSGTAAETGDVYYFGIQTEDALYTSAYIATAGSTASRIRDSYEVAFTGRVQTLTFYARYLSRGVEGQDASDRTVMAIGQSGASTRVQIEQAASATAFRVTLGDTVSTVASGTVSNATATLDQPVEVLCVLLVTPATRTATVTLSVAIAGVETTGTASSAKAVSDAFQGAKLALNAIPGSTTTDFSGAYTHAGVIRGSVSFAQARRMLRVS